MRPQENDYAPYYAKYIALVEGEDVLLTLDKQLIYCTEILKNVPKEKELFAYAEGKWTVKELIGHITDGERIFGYRALRIARNDKTPLPGWDENLFAKEGNFNNRSLDDIVNEWELLRKANLALFKTFTEEMLNRKGVSNKFEITANAIIYVLAGHLDHHLNILKERYLS